jgi:hypothetical protein
MGTSKEYWNLTIMPSGPTVFIVECKSTMRESTIRQRHSQVAWKGCSEDIPYSRINSGTNHLFEGQKGIRVDYLCEDVKMILIPRCRVREVVVDLRNLSFSLND